MTDYTNPARTANALRLAAYLVDDVSMDQLAQKLDGCVDLDSGVVDATLGGAGSESRNKLEDVRILTAIMLRYLEGLSK